MEENENELRTWEEMQFKITEKNTSAEQGLPAALGQALRRR